MALRPATWRDIWWTWRLRQEYDNVSLWRHLLWWFERSVFTERWIVEDQWSRVGTFRIDLSFVSIQIARSVRRHGYATQVLAWAAQLPGRLFAHVHKDNWASRYAFDRAGWFRRNDRVGHPADYLLYSNRKSVILEGTGTEAICQTSPPVGRTTPLPKP